MMAWCLIRINTCYLEQEIKGDKAVGIKVSWKLKSCATHSNCFKFWLFSFRMSASSWNSCVVTVSVAIKFCTQTKLFQQKGVLNSLSGLKSLELDDSKLPEATLARFQCIWVTQKNIFSPFLSVLLQAESVLFICRLWFKKKKIPFLTYISFLEAVTACDGRWKTKGPVLLITSLWQDWRTSQSRWRRRSTSTMPAIKWPNQKSPSQMWQCLIKPWGRRFPRAINA